MDTNKWKSVESDNHLTEEEVKYFDSQEKNNIFEGAKFGNKFVSIADKTKIYLYIRYVDAWGYGLLPEDSEDMSMNYFDEDGFGLYGNIDNVSKYHEDIDDEKLEEDSYEYIYNESNDWLRDSDNNWNDAQKAFKAGYRKAKED